MKMSENDKRWTKVKCSKCSQTLRIDTNLYNEYIRRNREYQCPICVFENKGIGFLLYDEIIHKLDKDQIKKLIENLKTFLKNKK
jgi:DNA-directed RNA polymerase subunit RPC12/RpoP